MVDNENEREYIFKKRLSKKEEKKLEENNPSLYESYYNYSRSLYEKSKIANLKVKTRKKLFPLLYGGLVLQNRLNGNTVEVINDKRIKSNKTKIYAVTHIGKYDIEMVNEAIKDPTYLLSGDFENVHGTFGGAFIELNGVVYVNEHDKEDRKTSKERMKQILKDNGNLLYFPEGAWEFELEKPVLKLFPGIIDVALSGNAEIIPVAIEQYGKKFVVSIGKNIDTLKECENGKSKKEILANLRDEMATLKWEIFEKKPIISRNSIPSDYQEKYIDERIKEWPGFSREEIFGRIYKDKNEITPEEVFKPIDELNIGTNNAFLLKKQRFYNK